MRLALVVLFSVQAHAAIAQQVLSVPANTSGLATAAQLAAVQAALPAPCPSAPSADTLTGTTGSATPCTSRADATRPTSVQAANVVTDGTGSWSVVFARPFVSSSPVVNPLPVNLGGMPVVCNVAARSATAASGRCWQGITNTLPGALTALYGLVVNVFSAATAGTPVMVIARESTQ